MAHLLAKKGHPYANAEFIRSCLMAAAQEICPQKISLSETVSLWQEWLLQESWTLGTTSVVDYKARKII